MCKTCVEAVREFFPDTPEGKYGDLLMSATAFPAGDAALIREQLREHRDAGCKTWEEACARANEEMDRVMRECAERERASEPEEPRP